MNAKVENLVNKNRNKLQEVIPLSTPYSIWIDPSNLCNFKCHFCAAHSSSKPQIYRKQTMSTEIFEKVIDDLLQFPEKLKTLRITGNGEPLINKDLPNMISYAKQKKVSKFIELTTNGSLLSPKMNRELIDSGIDRIRISIEALNERKYKEITGVDVDIKKLIDNIKDLYNNKKKCEIYIKIVNIALDNKEKENEFYRMFGDICDKIFIDNVIPLWSDFEELNNNSFKHFDKGVHGQEISEVSVCPYVFYSLMVNPDGQVTMCCADWQRKLVVGNITVSSLVDIWNGEIIREFWIDMLHKKKDKYDMCKRCVLPTFDCNDNIDEYAEEILKRL